MRQQRMARRGAVVGGAQAWTLIRISGGLLVGLVAAGTVDAQVCAPISGIERISVASDGTQGNAPSEIPAASTKGCVVAFKSFATNLIAVDTNDKVDVFVRDRSGTGTTERIPLVPFSGTEPQDNSYPPALDASGEIVAFGSLSNNLVANDFNQQTDLFVYVRGESGLPQAPSLAQGGDGGGRVPDQPPSVSADGKWVVFTSAAGDLVPGDDNQTNDVFLFERDTGTRALVSQTTTGSQPGTAGNGSSGGGAISADNCNVAFYSLASDLVPNDTNNDRDVFLRHVCAPEFTERVNVSSAGDQATRPSDRAQAVLEYPPAISADGRFVAFLSDQRKLDGVNSGGFVNVFVRDRQAGTTTRVSKGLNGQSADGSSASVSMSQDGRFVVFQSSASNLVEGDTNDAADVFVVELATGKIQRVSVTASGAEADGDSTFPQISPDGTVIVFQSDATNLVDGDTNGVSDIFIVNNPLNVSAPTPTATVTPTPTPTVTMTATASVTLTATVTATVTATRTPTATNTPPPTSTNTPPPTFTNTPRPTTTPTPTQPLPTASRTSTPTAATPTPTAGDSCGAVCSVGQGCRRQVGGQVVPGACVPDQNCLCIVGGTATPTPTAGDSCGAVCSVGQGCRRQVGGQILPGECVPDQNCLCIVGGTATPTRPSATATPTSGGGRGGGGGGGGCGCRIDPSTGRVADSTPWPALAMPAIAWFWRRRRHQS